MKLVTYIQRGLERVGFYREADQCVVPAHELNLKSTEMNDLIRELDAVSFDYTSCDLSQYKGIPAENIQMIAPIPNPEQDVICLGLNYHDHADEAEKASASSAYGKRTGNPVYFAKRVSRAVAPGQPVDGHFDIVDSLDYEVELAVVIGKNARNVKAEDADDYILGYTILNDMSARNLQSRHQQWYFGKSLDDFTPIGPWIVTRDELGEKPDLGIRCYINGEERQNNTTGHMIYDIPFIIEQLSAGMTLQAGTIISTGTPSGVVLGMPEPRQYLKHGDVIRCEIDGIGVLENPVE